MQYRAFGKTGCDVSTLGFGCMRLPLEEGAGTDMSRIDIAATTRLLDSAIAQGVNYVDTAYPYHEGHSEPVVGKVLEELKQRGNVMLATKMPSWAINTAEDMQKYFDEQCQRLRTEYIDFYLLHTLNKGYWPKLRDLGALEFLEKLKRQGRIRHIGFSFHDDLPVFEEILGAYDWEFCQIQYNYMDEAYQAGSAGLVQAVQKGMGVVIMEPLRGGNLAQTPPPDIQAVWDAAPVRRTPAEWALRWLLDKAGVSVILSGMNTQEQLDENLRVCADHKPDTLMPAELDAIHKVRDIFSAKVKVPCTACNYCMPCPSGVNIPGVFRIYNQYGLFGNRQWAAGMYNFIMAATDERADHCVACGQCEEACPQHIQIIDTLKQAHATLEACGMP